MTSPTKISILRATRASAALFLMSAFATLAPLHAAHDVLIVKGEAGAASYLQEINATALQWETAAAKGGHRSQTIEAAQADTSQLETLRSKITTLQTPSQEPVWIVLLGHGSAQGKTPKFALHGRDLTPEDLSSMLAHLRRPTILVAGFACSGAFVPPLSAADRVLLAATRSGREDNWSQFPKHFADAIASPDADMDADGEVSVFEAWFHACRSVEANYKKDGRLLTEHAILFEPSSQKPLEYALFATKPKEPPKVFAPTEAAPQASQWHLIASELEASLSAEARNQRQIFEMEIASLRKLKASLDPSQYQQRLEAILLQIHALTPTP